MKSTLYKLLFLQTLISQGTCSFFRKNHESCSRKKVREINSLLNSFHGTVWKLRKFTLTEKIFHQITNLVISTVKLLLWRNFCQKSVRANFGNFHTVHGENIDFSVKIVIGTFHTIVWKNKKFSLTLFWQKFRESNDVTNKLLKSWFHHGIFFRWEGISRFSTLCTLHSTKIYTHTFLKKFRESKGFTK